MATRHFYHTYVLCLFCLCLTHLPTYTMHKKNSSLDPSKNLNLIAHKLTKQPLKNKFPLTNMQSYQDLRKFFKQRNEKDETIIHKACKKGDLRLLLMGCAMSLDLNQMNKKGKSPLHLAVEKGFRLITKILILKGAKIDETALNLAQDIEIKKYLSDTNYIMPLSDPDKNQYIACMLVPKKAFDLSVFNNTKNIFGEKIAHFFANHNLIEPLVSLAKEFDINTENNQGETPLHILIKAGSNDGIEALLEAKVQPDDKALELAPTLEMYRQLRLAQKEFAKDDTTIVEVDDTVTHQPIKDLNDKILSKIITNKRLSENEKGEQLKEVFKNGTAINIYNEDEEYTVLELAIENNSLASVKVLVKNGAKLDKKGSNWLHPLTYAVKTKNIEIVKYLLEKGANVNVTDGSETPLNLAIEKDDLEMVLLLIKNGADIHGANLKETPLQTAVRYLNHEKTAILETLLKEGASINDDGWTPCHYAAYYRCESALKFLINHGAATNEKTVSHGYTVLHLACCFCKSTINLLLNNKADINAQDKDGNTPLHHAIERKDYEIAHTLIAAGANLNIQNNLGETALHIAIKKNITSLIKELINKGANVNIKNSANQTPVQIAQLENNPKIIFLLGENGATFENWSDSLWSTILAGTKSAQEINDYAHLVNDFYKLAHESLSLEKFAEAHLQKNHAQSNLNTIVSLLPYGNKKTTDLLKNWCIEKSYGLPVDKIIYAK